MSNIEHAKTHKIIIWLFPARLHISCKKVSNQIFRESNTTSESLKKLFSPVS